MIRDWLKHGMAKKHITIPKKTQFRTPGKDNILLFVPDIRFYDDKTVSFKLYRGLVTVPEPGPCKC